MSWLNRGSNVSHDLDSRVYRLEGEAERQRLLLEAIMQIDTIRDKLNEQAIAQTRKEMINVPEETAVVGGCVSFTIPSTQ